MAALPDVIGQTIGEMVAGGVAGRNGNGAAIAKKLAMNAGGKPYSGAKQVQQYRPVSVDDPNLQWSDDPENPYAITKEEFLRYGGQFGEVGVLPAIREEEPIIVTGQRRQPRPELSPEVREIARAAAQAAIAARRERRAAEFRADTAIQTAQMRAAGAEFNRYALNQTWQFARDWAPGISDVNGFYEAYRNPTLVTVGAATIGLIPIVGDAAGRGLRHLDEIGGAAQTGGRLTWLNPEHWTEAERAYDRIRQDPTDIDRIAAASGMSASRVARVKQHVFEMEHRLDDGVIGRLDPDPEIVNAWDRLAAGSPVQSDLDLLQHELFESRFEGIYGTTNRTAHEATLRSGRTWRPEGYD